MKVRINMLFSCMIHWIIFQLDRALAITFDFCSFLLFFSYILKNSPQPNNFTTCCTQRFCSFLLFFSYILKYSPQPNNFRICCTQRFIFFLSKLQLYNWILLAISWNNPRSNDKSITTSRSSIIQITSSIWISITYQFKIK